MLEGVVPFPPEFAQRYRDRGYWQDKSLRDEFAVVFNQYRDRNCIIDGDRTFTYGDIDKQSTTLALNLLELGIKPLDRVVVVLPNVAEFVILYFALQKISAIPIAALAIHRYAEISQFVQLSGASTCVIPGPLRDFDHADMVERIRQQSPNLKIGIILDKQREGFACLKDLIAKPATLPESKLAEIQIDPTDPAVFQLSGGTTGIPKLIPRTHNDYAYNSKVAASVCGIDGDSALLLVLPIAHNLPLACPGIQGFMFHGARVVISSSTKPEDMCREIAKNKVTHLKVVPSLLIRVLNDPAVGNYDLSSLRIIQSGGQCLQPETRALTKRLLPNAFIQENFGMAEGLLTFVRLDDPEDVKMGTVGRPVCPDDEVKIIDDDGNEVPFGQVGEMACRGPYTLRGYYGVPDYNKRTFTPDGFYRSGDLMRQHPSGAYIVEGRKKDLINRGGEKISAEEVENLILSHPSVRNVACIPLPDPAMGERMCGCVILHEGKTLTFDELKAFLLSKEIAKYKVPERFEIMQEFPLSPIGKVSKKALVEMFSAQPEKRNA